ncbi:MAG: helical backbone metal receptor [Bacteroidia bacterium]|nr:helical backbone metal receptor [Bacteroidia bacterium]
MRKSGFLLLMAAALLWAGCRDGRRKLVEAAPLISTTYRDDAGRQFSLADPPDSVISLAPNITEMIFAIGAEDRLAARSQACDYPPAAAMLNEIVTYPALDLEQIQAAGGDLLITTDEIFTPDDIAQLERLGLPIYLQSYDSLADVYRCIRTLGELLDRREPARRLADSLQQIERAVSEAVTAFVKYKTVILISADPLKVVGGTGFLNELLVKAGGTNVFAGKPEAYYSTTVEELLQQQPEVMILPSTDPQVYAQLIALYPALYNTPAEVNKQVHTIHPDLLYRPGPRMIEGLAELAHLLHSSVTPDRFLPGKAEAAE